jgi:hypothetical protein
MSSSDFHAVPPWLPADALAEIDVSELAQDAPGLRDECVLLGVLLGANVAAYRQGAKGRPRGLCSYYRAAELGPAQLAELARAEHKFPGVLFVAYRCPLELHDA